MNWLIELNHVASAADLEKNMGEHVEYLDRGVASGRVVTYAGRKDEHAGGVIVVAGTRAEAESFAQDDPFVRRGLSRARILSTLDDPLDTAFTRMLGLTVPLAQAPMGRCAPAPLAAAVSQAGGLGMLGLTWDDADAIEARLRDVRAATDRPFAVNLGLEWDQTERLAQVLDLGIGIVSFFWGDARAYLPRCREAGARTIVTIASVDEAKTALDAGADILCVQGSEAGGHVRTTLPTMVLLPAVVDVAENVPVLAAGGVADGRGLAAVLALGGAGAWMGTRFLLSEEAAAHPEYKAQLVAARGADAVKTTIFDRTWPDAPHRVLRNSTLARWEAAGRPGRNARPGSDDVVAQGPKGPVHRYDEMGPTNAIEGDVEAMALYAGQSVELISEIEPASRIVERVARAARDIFSRGPASRSSV